MAGIKHKKLKEWVGAGVIEQITADKIQAYEDARKKGRFGNSLVNLSLFAILVGVLSIIASNWHDIPGSVKIGVHALLNLAVGYIAIRSDKRGNDLWREGAAFTLFGLTFTLIILIGQVLQLTGNLAGAMLLWMLAISPFVWLMGRSYFVNVIWVLAVLVTIGATLFEYLKDAPDLLQFYVASSYAAYTPLILLALGASCLLDKVKPVLKNILQNIGFIWLVISASCGASVGFADSFQYTLHSFGILAAGLAALGGHAFLHQFYKEDEHKKIGALLAFGSFVMMFLPVVMPSYTPHVFSAFIFVGYWIFIGWVGQKLDMQRLVSLAVFVIAIRIFVAYVDLFGTLLTTGVRLIVSGLVMLGLIHVARKVNTRLTKGVSHAK